MDNKYDSIKKKVEKLIEKGKIKNEEELQEIPIDKLFQDFQLCAAEVICYFCYKNNNGCIHNAPNCTREFNLKVES